MNGLKGGILSGTGVSERVAQASRRPAAAAAHASAASSTDQVRGCDPRPGIESTPRRWVMAKPPEAVCRPETSR